MFSQNESDRRKTKITNVATLRIVVAGYLIYLGFSILRDVQKGEPGSLPVWVLWLAGIVFIVFALGFGYYTWRQYQKEIEALRSESAEKNPAEDDPENRE